MAIHPIDYHRAASRLENVHLPSPTTQAALRRVEQNPSEASLIDDLASRGRAPVALTVFSALRSESEDVFEAVCEAIHCDPYVSWSLVESLNQLPWYNGVRAFLSLPDDPCSSPVVYPFYILARNKTFVTADASRDRYDYYVKGLWRTLATARCQRWCDPDRSIVCVIELLRHLLDTPHPDPFVVHFASLLFGDVAPRSANVAVLKGRVGEDCCLLVRETAALVLKHMGEREVPRIHEYSQSRKKVATCMMKALAALFQV